MKFSPHETAIILIEFQNQWTEPGFYNFLIKSQLEKRSVIKNTVNLVDAGRNAGYRIVHAPLIIDPANKKGLLAHLTFGRVFTKGTRKAQITDGLYQPEDIVIKGRYAFDAFKGSDLEELLMANGLKVLLFAGFTTDQCVAKTMRTAITKGFECYMAAGCTATFSGLIQKMMERRFNPSYLCLNCSIMSVDTCA
jgi:nicotinamidase-related amidase